MLRFHVLCPVFFLFCLLNYDLKLKGGLHLTILYCRGEVSSCMVFHMYDKMVGDVLGFIEREGVDGARESAMIPGGEESLPVLDFVRNRFCVRNEMMYACLLPYAYISFL